MDAYFAYVSDALAVPVPKLATYLADSSANFTDTDEDGFINHPSPFRTESSEANTTAGSSLVTSIDRVESRPSTPVVWGVRRVKIYGDLRSLPLFHLCVSGPQTGATRAQIYTLGRLIVYQARVLPEPRKERCVGR